jgi:hypothetical protein
MSADLLMAYRVSLSCADAAVRRGDRDGALHSLKQALQAANKSKDARYRRAAFRALSFTRRIPSPVTVLA